MATSRKSEKGLKQTTTDDRIRTGELRTDRQKRWDEKLRNEDEYSEWFLAWELRRLNHVLGHVPLKSDLLRHGRHSDSTYYNHFDSYVDALEAAGLDIEEYEQVRNKRRNPNRLSKGDLAREVNRMYYEMGKIPTWSDIYEDSRYGRSTYEERFEGHSELLRESNITPPLYHVTEAIKDYVDAGRSYGTSKQLKSFMYPKGDMSDLSSDFGVADKYTKDKEAIKESWEYPMLSTNRITSAIKRVSEGEVEDVDAEVWSDSQKTTWRFEIHE